MPHTKQTQKPKQYTIHTKLPPTQITLNYIRKKKKNTFITNINFFLSKKHIQKKRKKNNKKTRRTDYFIITHLPCTKNTLYVHKNYDLPKANNKTRFSAPNTTKNTI